MFLHSVGHFHPENVITNAFLEELGIETTASWILERVGIHQRHTVLPLDYIRQTKNRDVRGAVEAQLYTNAETGLRAAQMALSRAGLKSQDLGMVVAGGCSPDECIPAAACRVAEALGVEAPALDISAACSSFGAQLHFLAGMRPERLPDYVLLVSAENSTRVVDYSDRSSCILWGDATSAAIVSPRIPGPWRIEHTLLRGDASGADKVKVPRLGHFTQQGSAVQAFAIKKATETFTDLARHFVEQGGQRETLGFIGHQANLRMLESVERRVEVPSALHFYNVDRRGNCGAAGAPSVLSEQWDNPALPSSLAVAVVGSGLTWAGTLLSRQQPLK